MLSERLSHLDTKMDKIIDTLTLLARIEEKVFIQQQAQSSLLARTNKVERKLVAHTVCATALAGRVEKSEDSIGVLFKGISVVASAFTLSAIGIFMAWLFGIPPVG